MRRPPIAAARENSNGWFAVRIYAEVGGLESIPGTSAKMQYCRLSQRRSTMKRVLSISVALAASSLVMLATTSANSGAKKEVTFNKDIAPIFYKNCAECHRANDIAPMPLMSYKEV